MTWTDTLGLIVLVGLGTSRLAGRRRGVFRGIRIYKSHFVLWE